MINSDLWVPENRKNALGIVSSRAFSMTGNIMSDYSFLPSILKYRYLMPPFHVMSMPTTAPTPA